MRLDQRIGVVVLALASATAGCARGDRPPDPVDARVLHFGGTIEGWAGPLRTEVLGTPAVLAVDVDRASKPFVAVADAERDSGEPMVDLASVSIDAGFVRLEVHEPVHLFGSERDVRLAYGVVVDLDADGVPDRQVGMRAAPNQGVQAWVTDLSSGTTIVLADATRFGALGVAVDWWFFGESARSARIWVAPSCGSRARLYVWASSYENDRFTALDTAPDQAWIAMPTPRDSGSLGPIAECEPAD